MSYRYDLAGQAINHDDAAAMIAGILSEDRPSRSDQYIRVSVQAIETHRHAARVNRDSATTDRPTTLTLANARAATKFAADVTAQASRLA